MATVGTDISSRISLDTAHAAADTPFPIVANIGRRRTVDDVRDVAVIDDLYRGWAADYEVLDLYSGAADCAVVSDAYSPITPIGPVQPVAGYFFFSRFTGGKPDRGIAYEYDDDDK